MSKKSKKQKRFLKRWDKKMKEFEKANQKASEAWRYWIFAELLGRAVTALQNR